MSHKLDVIDLCPRFLDFYESATRDELDPDNRWALWQQTYCFAAVPPTPEGQQTARALLDGAWGKYPEALDRIRAGAAGLAPTPIESLESVAKLLDCNESVHMQVIVFVGGFEGNAFVFELEGVTTLALPVEQEADERALLLPHEMTHVVHTQNSGMAPTWERSVARLVLEEGLATRVTAELMPGHTPADYTNEVEPGWFQRCETHAAEILSDIRDNLAATDTEATTRYAIAPGPAGITRTAYYAGWEIIGALTNAGSTLANLSKTEEIAIPALIRSGIDLLLDEVKPRSGHERRSQNRPGSR